MNTNKYILASLAIAVFIFLYGWVVHGIFLAEFWTEQLVEGSMRPQGQEIMWAIIVSCLLQGLALGLIFVKGYQSKGIMEGLRFGLLIAWFIVAIYFLHYALSPMTITAMVTGMITDGVMYLICGVILAALYRETPVGQPLYR